MPAETLIGVLRFMLIFVEDLLVRDQQPPGSDPRRSSGALRLYIERMAGILLRAVEESLTRSIIQQSLVNF